MSEDKPKYVTSSGRIVSQGERVAAARARLVADAGRGISTPQWIRDLAEGKSANGPKDEETA